MTDAYPEGLPEDRQELWRVCDATVHSGAKNIDGAKQFALFIRQQLRLEAVVAVLTEACTQAALTCSNPNSELRRMLNAAIEQAKAF